MRRVSILVVLLALAAPLGLLAQPADTAEAQAVAAAEAWLATVDAGDYGKSWDDAAKLFRGAVTKEAWEQAAAGVRTPLGAATSRKLKSKQAATSLPGAPDGHYVVIQFETVFEHKREAVETVTPMLDDDGVWRVSGYFVR
jgi:Protein of unknown function (DUF4019)